MIVNILLGMMAIVLVIALLLLVRIFKHRDRMYEVAYVDERDNLVMNNVFKTRYAIDTIDYVRLFCRQKVGSYSGGMQVVLKNGRTSRTFYFDGSVATKKLMFWTSYDAILQAMSQLEASLTKQHIRVLIEK